MASSAIELSPYAERLDRSAKRRYIEKVQDILVDPYLIARKDLHKIDELDVLPNIQYMDIAHYLVYTTSYVTAKEMKARKSLLAYKNFECGWVLESLAKQINEKFVLIGKVRLYT